MVFRMIYMYELDGGGLWFVVKIFGPRSTSRKPAVIYVKVPFLFWN